MDSVSESLIAAQNKAAALFAEVADSGMIRAGKLESELTADIHALARSRFDVRRHWHRRIARSGPNILDPVKHRLVSDIEDAFRRGKESGSHHGNGYPAIRKAFLERCQLSRISIDI